uniref:Uncharacterized protein n=1 Tax=Cannabis sativa TaxID=3483 RepID=A0A803QS98_CANSA
MLPRGQERQEMLANYMNRLVPEVSRAIGRYLTMTLLCEPLMGGVLKEFTTCEANRVGLHILPMLSLLLPEERTLSNTMRGGGGLGQKDAPMTPRAKLGAIRGWRSW